VGSLSKIVNMFSGKCSIANGELQGFPPEILQKNV